MNKNPYQIGEIPFRDVTIKVYHDKDSSENDCISSWQMRNPETCYTGHIFYNFETGKSTYPEGAVIPVQTKEDREILPKIIISGKKELDDSFIDFLNLYLNKEYKRRNGLQ